MSEPILDARTFWELLDRRASATPDGVALLDAADRSMTWGELRDRAERVAAGFSAMGVGEGTPVTWELPTRIETVVASLALSRLGATQNPIIQIYRDREVGFCIRQTGAELVLVPGMWNDYDYAAMVERVTADLPSPPRIVVAYDELPEGDPATLPAPPVAPADPDDAPIRWIYYTSGTTSDPKGAQHTDGTLIAGGVGLAKALNMNPSDVGSIAFPYAHIGGPNYIVTMMVNGFPAVLLERFAPADAIEIYRRHGVTMAGGSTAFYTMFLAEQRKQPGEPPIPSLRMLSGGGAPKPPEVYFEVADEMGIPVCHGYGMTECPMICQGGPDDTPDQLAHTEGHPVYGCEVSIVDADGTPVPPDTEGEVRVAGPMVFKGYRHADLNADAFDDQGRFRTGDLGIKRADGHVTLTGRLKDVIIRKGENISAKEVEDILYTHPKVGAVAVIGLPDRDRGERVCAVVEPASGAEPLTFDEMVAYCREAGLMIQKTPEQLETMEVLPRNATLKILKFELRDKYKDQPWP
ncbi:MAG: AMP-binding protein [Acidimicrobiales bacterium]|nr:AMP-binding protein [Acidimicrobiales bacterium]